MTTKNAIAKSHYLLPFPAPPSPPTPTLFFFFIPSTTTISSLCTSNVFSQIFYTSKMNVVLMFVALKRPANNIQYALNFLWLEYTCTHLLPSCVPPAWANTNDLLVHMSNPSTLEILNFIYSFPIRLTVLLKFQSPSWKPQLNIS